MRRGVQLSCILFVLALPKLALSGEVAPPSVALPLERIYYKLKEAEEIKRKAPRAKTHAESSEEYNVHVVIPFNASVARELDNKMWEINEDIKREWAVWLTDISFDWIDYKQVVTNLRLGLGQKGSDLPSILGGDYHAARVGLGSAHALTLIERRHPFRSYSKSLGLVMGEPRR